MSSMRASANNVVPAFSREAPGLTISRGRKVIEMEGRALLLLANSLDRSFSDAVQLLLDAPQRVIVSGMGKSGHIGRKIAATLASTGTPALFLHPAEAAHGDLGMIVPGDVILIFSNSGATQELQSVLRHVKDIGCAVIGIASQPNSPLMTAADVALTLPLLPEACPRNIAPTTSTALMLGLGDALAVAVMESRGLTRDHLRLLHPGGSIGNRLTQIDHIMHGPEFLPLVRQDAPMHEVVIEMTQKRMGIAGVVGSRSQLVGVITDGDLRRHSEELFHSTASDVMTTDPKWVMEGTLSEDALEIMQEHRITALFVMAADQPDIPVGLVHIHDFGRIHQG